MSKRGKKSKKVKLENLEENDFEQSFTIEEVKENLRKISEKFLKLFIEGVNAQGADEMREMGSIVRQMKKFLIERKNRAANSKSMRQLEKLEIISPLLDSANYLTSLAEDYLNKLKEKTYTNGSNKEIPREHQEKNEHSPLNNGVPSKNCDSQQQTNEDTNEHDSSFVDMFLDDSQEEGKPETQKLSFTGDNSLNITQTLNVTPSKSILKTASSETPGIQKRISFAKKATKVYEDNETSQISLAKSSGSAKSVDDYEPKANPHQSTQKGSSSEIVFSTQIATGTCETDDNDSIVETSFQEEIHSTLIPRNAKLFKANHLMSQSQVTSKPECRRTTKTNDSEPTSSTNDRAQLMILSTLNQVSVTNEPQKIEVDALLSQDSKNFVASEPQLQSKAKQKVPFHNFVLKLPQDSSDSEDSLDARVNMAINLVNMKPREPEIEPPANRTETPNNSTDGIVQSSLTCTDFRWLEYNRFTSLDSSLKELQRSEIPKLPATIFEDAPENLMPPFDLLIETTTEPPLDNQQQELKVPPHLSSSVFPPQPTWANPFKTSISKSGNTCKALKTEMGNPEPGNSLKGEVMSREQSTKSMCLRGKHRQTLKKTKDITTGQPMQDRKVQQQSLQGQASLPKLEENSKKSDNQCLSTAGASAKLDFTNTTKHKQKPAETTYILQETYDSHKVSKNINYHTQHAFKKALQDSVLAAKSKWEDRCHPKPTVAGRGQGQNSKNGEDEIKIARMQQFGKLWCDLSSRSSSDPKTNQIKNQSKGKQGGTQAERSVRENKSVIAQIPRSTQMSQITAKPCHEKMLSVSPKEKNKLDNGKGKISDNYHFNQVERDETHDEEEPERAKETNSQKTNKKNNTSKQNSSKILASSTSLPDTILVDNAQLENDEESCTGTDNLILRNTSSMICETSFSEENPRRSRRKQTDLSQKKNSQSQNSQKPATKRPRGRPKKANKGKTLSKNIELSTLSESMQACNSREIGVKQGQPQTHKSPGKLTKKQDTFTSASTLVQASASNVQPSGCERVFRHAKQGQHTPPPPMHGLNQAHQCLPTSKPAPEQRELGFQPQKHRAFQMFTETSTLTEAGFLSFQQLQVSPEPFKRLELNAETNKPFCEQTFSAQAEPWLLNVQQERQICKMDGTSEESGKNNAPFLTAQPETTFEQFEMFNVRPKVLLFDQKSESFKNNGEFDFPFLPEQAFQNHSDIQQPNPAMNSNQMQLSRIDAIMDCRTAGSLGTTETTTEVRTTDCRVNENLPNRETSSQTKKRSAQDGTVKSQKVIKLQCDTSINDTLGQQSETQGTLGTQGTEVLFEPCDNLSWASDTFPNTQTFDSQMITEEMFDTQMINTRMFDSQMTNSHTLDSQSVHQAAEIPFQGEAFSQLPWGLKADHEEPKTKYDIVEAQETRKHHENKTGTEKATLNQNDSQTYIHQQNANNRSENIKSQEKNQTAYSEFRQGVEEKSTELTTEKKMPDSEAPQITTTVDEEIDELLRSIEWVRRIPESELIPAANIDELFNEQTHVW